MEKNETKKLVDDLRESKLFTVLANTKFAAILVTDPASRAALDGALDLPSRCEVVLIDDFKSWIAAISAEKAASYKYIAASFQNEASLARQLQMTLRERNIGTENVYALFADIFVALNAPFSRSNPLLAKLDAIRSGIALPSIAGKALASRVDVSPVSDLSPSSYVIISLPRSGSTMLANVLTLTGQCGYPREHLRNGILSLAEFTDFNWHNWMNAVIRLNRTPNHVFGTKVISHFLFRALRIGDQRGDNLFEALKPGPKLIYLKRQDKVAQAISRHFARSSGFFKADFVLQQSKRRRAVKDVTYDFDTINDIVTRMEKEEARLAGAVDAFGAEVLTVAYEDLETHLDSEIKKILSFLGQEPSEGFRAPQPRTRKTRDARNQDFYECFKRDLRGRV